MRATLERLRQRRENTEDEGGFTLIELLIVIVILGVLAAIVVFAVENLTGQSQVAACQSQYKTVETAAEAYKAETGAYPTTITALGSTATGGNGFSGTEGPWLKDLPPTASGAGVPYYLSIDTGTVNPGSVMVGTGTGAATDGMTNCNNA